MVPYIIEFGTIKEEEGKLVFEEFKFSSEPTSDKEIVNLVIEYLLEHS